MASFNLPEKFRLLHPHSVDREILGQQFTFYPCSLGAITRMAFFIQKIAGHLSVLLSDDRADRGRSEENFTNDDGAFVNKIVVSEANPETLALRSQQRADAIEGAVNALLDPENRVQIGLLIMNSLRDDFPRQQTIPSDEAAKFVEGLELPVFVEFVKGLAEANTKVFGDVLGKFRTFLETRLPGLAPESPEATTEQAG